MAQSKKNNELTEEEVTDLCFSTNTIVSHITDGNSIEEEVTCIMGGEIYELPSEWLKREGREEGLVEGREEGRKEARAEFESILAEKDREIAMLKAQLSEKTS